MIVTELIIDVTGRVAIDGPLKIAAAVYMPEPRLLKRPARALVALPGGGYSKGYFNIAIAGHTGYSQAEHHVERGIILIALDPLGAGKSSSSQFDRVSIDSIAAANDFAVRAIVQMLEDGTLAAGYPPLPQLVIVGIGQSMGGCLTIVTQARFDTYDAIAVLGFSAIQTVLPQRTAADTESGKSAYALDRNADFTAVSPELIAAVVPDLRYCHHWEDVPDSVVQADFGGGYPVRRTCPDWGSSTVPPCCLRMLAPGFASEDAAAIEVPIFLAFGERDVSENPWAEPSAYTQSRDVSLFIAPKMAHMHNFASTRRVLWDRLQAWSRLIPAESK